MILRAQLARDIDDVVALITVARKLDAIALELAEAQIDRASQRHDLVARVVDVIFLRHLIAGSSEKIAQDIATTVNADKTANLLILKLPNRSEVVQWLGADDD